MKEEETEEEEEVEEEEEGIGGERQRRSSKRRRGRRGKAEEEEEEEEEAEEEEAEEEEADEEEEEEGETENDAVNSEESSNEESETEDARVAAMALQYGSSADWKFTSRNEPPLSPSSPPIAPGNAVGRVFILPGEYPPYAKDRANEGADFVGWMGNAAWSKAYSACSGPCSRHCPRQRPPWLLGAVPLSLRRQPVTWLVFNHPGVVTSMHENNTVFHCEFHDAFDYLDLQVLDTCRMLS